MRVSNRVVPAEPVRRAISIYLVVSLVAALLGPAIVVYAAEGEQTLPSQELTATPLPPAEEQLAPPEEQAPVVLPEETTPAVPQPAESPSAAACPPLEAGGVRITSPADGTYTRDEVQVAEPAPDELEIVIDAFATAEGSFCSFRSNQPVDEVVVCGPSGTLVFDLDGAYAFSWLHAPATDGSIYPEICSLDFYFCEQPETSSCLQIGKYLDEDRDQVRDDGEEMLQGWEFVLYDARGVEVRRGVTNAQGLVCFYGLPQGTYCAEETLQSGWANTTPLRQSVYVCDGQWSRLCFGNVPVEEAPETGRLVVRKFYDADRDGMQDEAEALLAGWHFVVRNAQDETVTTLVTGADGSAGADLPPGVYSVNEVAQQGWTNTTSAVRSATVVADADTEVLFGNAPVQVPQEFLPFTETPTPDPFLPFTGGEYLLVVGGAFMTGACGLVLRRKRR